MGPLSLFFRYSPIVPIWVNDSTLGVLRPGIIDAGMIVWLAGEDRHAEIIRAGARHGRDDITGLDLRHTNRDVYIMQCVCTRNGVWMHSLW